MNNNLQYIKKTKGDNILSSYIKVSWFIIPLLFIELLAHFFNFYKLEKYQLILVLIGIISLILFNILKKNKWFKSNFYLIQSLFLFTLIFFEFLWYIDQPSSRQLVSLLLGTTITGVALIKPKNSILFFIITIISLLVINYFKHYEIFQYASYFFVSGVCIVAFNYWRFNINRYFKISESSYKNMFYDSADLIFVVDKNSLKILELNNTAKAHVNNLSTNTILDVFSLDKEKKQIQDILKSIDSTKKIQIETDLDTEHPDYIPKQISFRQSTFFNNEVVIITVNSIKERKQHEKLLEESKENITKVLENIKAFVYIVSFYDNGNRSVKFLSKKAENILEMPLDEIIEKFKSNKISEIGLEEDLPLIKHKHNLANKTLKPQTIVYRIKVNNKIKWVEEKIFPKRENDAFVHFSIVTDITDSKENEIKYYESEQNYKRLFDKSLSGIYKTTFEGEIIEANIAFANLLGFDSITELKKHNIKEFYLEKNQRELYLSKLKNQKNLINHISFLKDINGKSLIVNNNVFIQKENNQEIITGSLVDITELHQISEALKISKEKYKLLFEESTNGILLIDLDTNYIIDANNNAANLFNTTKQNLFSNDILSLIKSNNNNNNVQKFINNDKSLKLEIDVVNSKTKQIKYLSLTKVKLFFNNKRIIQVVINDITELKEKEKFLLQNQNTFKNIVDSSPASILIFTNNQLVYKNPLADELYQKFLNKNSNQFDEIFNEKQLFVINQVIQELNQSIKSYTEISFTHHNKTYKYSLNVVNVLFENKESILLIFRDISLELEYNIQKLRAELAETLNKDLEKEIKKRKQTEKQLLESKKFNDNLFDSSIDMIIATDVNDVITSVNKAALDRFGYLKHELIGQPLNIIYPKGFSQDYIFQAIHKTDKFVGEVENIDKNGNTFISYLSATTIRDNKGKIKGYMGISRDLSELEEIKKIISSQSSLIDSLLQNESDIFIWTLNKQLELISCNIGTNNYFNKLSKNNDLQIGKNFLNQINPYIREKYIDTTKELYLKAVNGEKVHFEALMENDKGQKFWIDVHITPVLLPDGTINEIICLGTDITENKNQIKLIKERELNIRAMVNAIPDLLIKVNRDGFVLDYEVNSQDQLKILKSFYKNIDHIIGENVSDIYKNNPKFYKKITTLINNTIKHNKVYTQNFNYKYKGKTLFFEARYSKINEQEVIIVVRNQTDEIENELKLLESVKEKEILLKEVHHRVKNNLQIINSILNLQSSYISDKKILEIITESQNRIRSMSYIHESLYQTENFSSINFKGYIDNLINNLVYSYQVGNDLTIEKNIDDIDLSLDYAIPCGLILNELITNALKYAYKSNEPGKILIKIKGKQENFIEMSVQDFGQGLPKDFDIETTETLGLSLVHTLVDQIDGKLLIKNDGGTNILIIFEVKEI
jgi:PAS domain S-box-containing protein